MRTVDRVELQQQLLMCVGTVEWGERTCENVAAYVGWAMKPARGGQRTDVTLFGVCSLHVHHRQGIEALLGEQGFQNASLVPWEHMGEVLEMLEDARLLRVA